MTTREQLGPTLVVGGFEITLVERVTLRHRRLGSANVFEGEKRPVAILVRSPDGERRIELGEAEPRGPSDGPEAGGRS
jgi:hypothetical protein